MDAIRSRCQHGLFHLKQCQEQRKVQEEKRLQEHMKIQEQQKQELVQERARERKGRIGKEGAGKSEGEKEGRYVRGEGRQI